MKQFIRKVLCFYSTGSLLLKRGIEIQETLKRKLRKKPMYGQFFKDVLHNVDQEVLEVAPADGLEGFNRSVDICCKRTSHTTKKYHAPH